MLTPDGFQNQSLAADDGTTPSDPNLQLQRQRAAAAPAPGTPVTPPPPPPLPTTSMTTTSTTGGRAGTLASPTAARDATGGVPATTPQLSSAAPAGAYKSSDVDIGSRILPNADPRLANLRGLVDAAAGGLANVDRVQLAKDAFNTFKSESDPAYKADLDLAEQYGAAGGQVGSGMLRTKFGNLALQRARDLQNEQDRLIQGATEGSIADAFNKFGALSGAEGQVYGENANDRNELRGERGYQVSLEQQAFERALQSYEVGQQGNPSDYLLQMAKQYGGSPEEIAALARQLGLGSVGK